MTDLATSVGGLALPAPILTASGTAGHGAELAAYGDLAALGAVVVKSLSVDPWPGNPAPRVHPAAGGAGMLNSVGLQGPGIAAWLDHDLPAMLATGARVVASVWGRTVEDYRKAAELLASAPPGVVAVEVNLSCPNLDGGRHLFAQSAGDSAEVIGACVDALGDRPVWAKLTAAVTSVVDVAAAVDDAGAAAVTCINTLLGMVLDLETRSYALGGGGGGLSGPAIHPVAVRAVHDVHAALPALPIVGVGGVSSGADAAELLLAGASAVQVGTATFADPRAPWRVQSELDEWCRAHGVGAVRELIGAVHG